MRYNFGSKPKPFVKAQTPGLNGVSIGKGHLAEAKAANQLSACGDERRASRFLRKKKRFRTKIAVVAGVVTVPAG